MQSKSNNKLDGFGTHAEMSSSSRETNRKITFEQRYIEEERDENYHVC